MAVSYNDTTKTARMNVALQAIDANTAPATLEIGTAPMSAVLVIVTLAKTGQARREPHGHAQR